MTLPRLYPILDAESVARRNLGITAAAEAMLEGGARILQFRYKATYTRAVFEEARKLAEICFSAGAIFIVDDRADVAAMLNAGVHVGQDDLPPVDVRFVVGKQAIVGHSTHNPAQFKAALREPVDYIAYGPVFSTTSKCKPDPVVGLEGVRLVRKDGEKAPLVAIGGITRQNVREVLAAGADSVAVIQDLLPENGAPAALRARMEEWQRLVKI